MSYDGCSICCRSSDQIQGCDEPGCGFNLSERQKNKTKKRTQKEVNGDILEHLRELRSEIGSLRIIVKEAQRSLNVIYWEMPRKTIVARFLASIRK